jgi:hypothetical protein
LILDPLRFIEYHDIEIDVLIQHIRIQPNLIVRGNQDRDGKVIQSVTVSPITLYNANKDVRRPDMELVLPVFTQRARGYNQHALTEVGLS